jgi:uncharacterized peroxidase-related enzyme
MQMIHVPAKEDVSTGSQLIFEHIIKRLGKLPNLYASIGYSEFALKAFTEFEETLYKGSFSPKEREAIALIVSEVNHCDYCLAAHTQAAVKRGFSFEETISIRKAEISDFKLHSIVRLAKSIAENKGSVTDNLLENFYTAGFNNSALMELIGLVTVRIFTNYVYAISNIPIDFPLAESLT